jgi:glycosyltransferase involved in cell wall biosynthesis
MSSSQVKKQNPVGPITVVVDHEIFATQAVGGISRYFVELCAAMRKLGTEPEIVAPIHINDYAQDLSNLYGLRVRPYSKTKQLRLWSNSIISGMLSLRKTYDILHRTYYCAPNFIRSKRMVTTAYDMIPELGYVKDRSLVEAKRRVLAQSDVILSISQSTKRDLMEILQIPSEKIVVTHLATSMGVQNPVEPIEFAKHIMSTSYLLYVGTRYEYKGWSFLVKSLSILHSRGHRLRLVCFGGGKCSGAERDLLSAHQLADFVSFTSGPDSELAWLYRHATCCVMPSLYEGFGLPIIEAISCECPLICSDLAITREIAGEAALYFEIGAEEQLANHIISTAEAGEARNQLMQKGINRSKKFSWTACAERTLDAYRLALS